MTQNGQHPALTDSLRRLAELERRSPPGYPLGYKLQRHHYSCQGCGAGGSFAILLTVRRASGNGKGYAPTAVKEVIYDLPVDTTDTHFLTTRCEACVAALPREPVPALPAYKVKLYKRKDAPKGDEVDLDDLFPEPEIDLEALGLL